MTEMTVVVVVVVVAAAVVVVFLRELGLGGIWSWNSKLNQR